MFKIAFSTILLKDEECIVIYFYVQCSKTAVSWSCLGGGGGRRWAVVAVLSPTFIQWRYNWGEDSTFFAFAAARVNAFIAADDMAFMFLL